MLQAGRMRRWDGPGSAAVRGSAASELLRAQRSVAAAGLHTHSAAALPACALLEALRSAPAPGVGRELQGWWLQQETVVP